MKYFYINNDKLVEMCLSPSECAIVHLKYLVLVILLNSFEFSKLFVKLSIRELDPIWISSEKILIREKSGKKRF